jgi:hypothetical protein
MGFRVQVRGAKPRAARRWDENTPRADVADGGFRRLF